jgi:hypothetical protein
VGKSNEVELYKMLAMLIAREIHAHVNAGTSLVKCLCVMEELRDIYEE